MSFYAFGLLGIGAAFASRPFCHASRATGAALIGFGLFLASAPAFARDETLLAKDNSEIACTVAKQGLTRISLKNDRFASLSKLQRDADPDNFSVVHEPNRGDIYLSLPDGYAKADVSFFGTTAKGFVYKFACRVAGEGTHQVFVENRDLVVDESGPVRVTSASESSVSLVQAMYAAKPLAGFDFRQLDLSPVRVGDLNVRMISEYRGSELSGRVLRIENGGAAAVTLDETVIAPGNAVAVSVAQPVLKPGQATTAYIVLPTGAVQ